jgi:hypothetical protein
MTARACLLWMWSVNFLIGQLCSAVDCWGSECSRWWVFVCLLSLSSICALLVSALARYGTVNVSSRADADTAPPFQMSTGHMVHLSLVRLTPRTHFSLNRLHARFHPQNSFFNETSPCAPPLSNPIRCRNVSMRAMQRSKKARRG